MKKSLDSKKIIHYMVLIALFSALSYLGTFIAIPVGISKVHLGNFICILAGLLCGGFVGGLSGAIGMGLNDLTSSYGPDTIIRTVIVKFIVGFLAGFLFRLFIKKDLKVKWIFTVFLAIFLSLFVTFLTLYVKFGDSFQFMGRTFKNSIFLIVCLGIFALLYLFSFMFSYLIKKEQQLVLLVASICGGVNVILEFIIKIPFKMLFASMTFEQAYAYAITSLPGALFTTILTVVFVTLTFIPLYLATRKINRYNDLSLEDLSSKN